MCLVIGWIYSCKCKHIIQEAPEVCHYAHRFGQLCKAQKIQPLAVSFPCRDCEEAMNAERYMSIYEDYLKAHDPCDDRPGFGSKFLTQVRWEFAP